MLLEKLFWSMGTLVGGCSGCNCHHSFYDLPSSPVLPICFPEGLWVAGCSHMSLLLLLAAGNERQGELAWKCPTLRSLYHYPVLLQAPAPFAASCTPTAVNVPTQTPNSRKGQVSFATAGFLEGEESLSRWWWRAVRRSCPWRFLPSRPTPAHCAWTVHSRKRNLCVVACHEINSGSSICACLTCSFGSWAIANFKNLSKSEQNLQFRKAPPSLVSSCGKNSKEKI